MIQFKKIISTAKGISDHLSHFSVSGTICPSSEFLAKAMLEEAQLFFPACNELIFCGIGTGAIADCFVQPVKEAGMKAVWADIEPSFCEAFAAKHQLPQSEVACGCISDLFRDRLSHPSRLIVSCLQTRGRSFGVFLENQLCAQVEMGAKCLFYSYLPHIPGSRFYTSAQEAQCLLELKRTVIANIPPAFIHTIVSNIPVDSFKMA